MKPFVARCTPWGTIQTGDFFQQLTPIEKMAVIAHENAHIASHDALKRLWWLLSLKLLREPEWVKAKCREQEFAADRCVKEQGLGWGMKSFLIRFPHPPGALHPGTKERLGALNG